jgi:hypothetical protein
MASEYALRYQADYDLVCWIRARWTLSAGAARTTVG